MALIACPDCGRTISDRAVSCPDCACPVAEVVAEQRAQASLQATVQSRTITEDSVDCPRCAARGYFEVGELMEWCVACEHTGRLRLGEASDGYYGVATYAVEKFLAGEIHPGASGVVFFVGKSRPARHRYEKPAARRPINPDDIPW